MKADRIADACRLEGRRGDSCRASLCRLGCDWHAQANGASLSRRVADAIAGSLALTPV